MCWLPPFRAAISLLPVSKGANRAAVRLAAVVGADRLKAGLLECGLTATGPSAGSGALEEFLAARTGGVLLPEGHLAVLLVHRLHAKSVCSHRASQAASGVPC